MPELVHRQWSFHAQEHSDQLSELCRRCQLATTAVQISAHLHHPVSGERVDYIRQLALTGVARERERLLQGLVREVLSLQLESGQAAQACVTLTQLNSNGGTQAAQVTHSKSHLLV